MSFRPSRSSPPPMRHFPSASNAGSTIATSVTSRSSATSAAELVALSSEDVDMMDEIIGRVEPAQTKFAAVFSAHNKVMQERGLDPQDLYYYTKLLKLGNLKAGTWADKWKMVKLEHGYGSFRRTQAEPKPRPQGVPIAATERLNAFLSSHRRPNLMDDDTETVRTEADSEMDDPTAQYHNTPRRAPSTTSMRTSGITTFGFDHNVTPNVVASRRDWDNDTPRASSSTPPSYRSVATRNVPASQQIPAREHPPATNGVASSAASRQAVADARQRRGTVNDQDAWAKIKMAQDEKEADQYFQDRLVERFWRVWKRQIEWSANTYEQLDQANAKILLHMKLVHWRNKTSQKLAESRTAVLFADHHAIRAVFDVWRSKTREKRQAAWRNEMRKKMKLVREMRNIRVLKAAWSQWREFHTARLAEKQFDRALVIRAFDRWKHKLSRVDQLEAAADVFSKALTERAAERCWNQWKRGAEVRSAERTVAERVHLRIKVDTMNAWKRRMAELSVSDAFREKMIVKSALFRWKAAQHRLKALEKRALVHVTRKDGLLVRAVLRVWRAHTSGELLCRLRDHRICLHTWTAWNRRMQQAKDLEQLALNFSTRSASNAATTALQTWHQVHSSHKKAADYADEYRDNQIRYQALLQWRLLLRAKMKTMKQARKAEKMIIVRRIWRAWTTKMADAKREKQLRAFQAKTALRYFELWFEEAQRQRHLKLSEQEMATRVASRVKAAALGKWMDHLIEIKLRQYEVAQKVELDTKRAAFDQWKAICIRHVEELNLMYSFQDVKREERICRIFRRWLANARTLQQRRTSLLAIEKEVKQMRLAAVWDKWREHYTDEKLRTIETEVLLQSQRNLLYRAFGIWHSKTKSLPAIRFHTSNTKKHIWDLWRGAMPRALEAKKAREKHNSAALTRAFNRWLQRYRTNIALKAVARARFLRLPTAAPRQPLSISRPTPASRGFPRLARAPTTDMETTEDEGPVAGASRPSYTPVSSRPFNAKSSIASLLASRPSREVSPPRPTKAASHRGAREISPARSYANSRRAASTRDVSPPPPARRADWFSSRPPVVPRDDLNKSPVRRPRAPTPSVDGETATRAATSTNGDAPVRSRLWGIQRRPRGRERSNSREPL